jgi:high frequency lysogenization protein
MSGDVLALAGVFQATELVRQAANHGTWSGYAATASLESLLRLEADSAEEVFGGRERVRLGLETMVSVLSGEEEHAENLPHAVALLQLQRKFTGNRAMMTQVGEELGRISLLGANLEAHQREDLQAMEINRLYGLTISQLSPRIVVKGRPQYLQNERTVSWVRTLLFAGLRAGVLWQQLGGGRFNLLFGRRKILDQANAALNRQ